MLNIAIDGPAGAGKSTVAKMLAKELNILYLDTGAMYRAAALHCLNCGRPIDKKEGLSDFLDGLDLKVVYEKGEQRTLLFGEDVGVAIREHRMSKAASDFSAHPEVRIKLVELQREIAKSCALVLDGRDIGTFVLKDAPFKFYLTASVEERAKRRMLEMQAKGEVVDLDALKSDIISRDYNDMNREFAPLRQAADAVVIDSSDISADEVVAEMLKIINGGGA